MRDKKDEGSKIDIDQTVNNKDIANEIKANDA